MYELLREWLDGVFYEGYTEDLQQTNLKALQQHFEQFKTLYHESE
jgi:hypothetical protein